MARHINVPLPQRTAGQSHRQCAGMPVLRKDRRVLRFGIYRPVPVAPAHIMDAAHAGASLAGVANAVPIIESRPTSATKASSLHPSVPSGRIGNTR